MKTRQEAIDLLNEYITSESLKRHCYSVAYSMEEYAEKFKEDKDLWFITGLLHDFDYEKFPTIPEHVTEGVKILKEINCPEEIIEAIQGHADYTGIPRNTLMAKTLFAVDELSGFVIALAKVKQGFDMDSNSIKKALKKKGFASGVNRECIQKGIEELNVNQDEHFELVIQAQRKHAKELGF
ncbi:HAD family hydrolase [Candidatus Pacearchaeota archaeon CG10_big_fil_rev_8_21_14_0_10_31_24]|nr:MAG: HAD family hydrolase [Candidatus Pacearchaeota archaeon CG10_big_fil_rev_8_21_14_0_10_31_24]